MKKIILALASLFLLNATDAQTLISVGKMEGGLSTNAHVTKTIRVPSTGRVIVAGWFEDSLDIDPATPVNMLYSSATGKSAFLATFTNVGTLEWANCFTSDADSVIINDMFVDDISGDIIVGGVFNGNFQADPTSTDFPMFGMGAYTGFVIRYDQFGYVVNKRTLGGASGSLSITSVTPYGSSVVLGGWFTGNVYMDDAGAIMLTAASGEDAFVSQIDDYLLYVNSHQYQGGTGNERVSQVMYDDGYVFIQGTFTNAIDLDFSGSGTSTNTSAGSTDVFFGKYDGGFNFSYGHSIGGAGADFAKGQEKGGYMVIEYTGTVDMNPLGAPTNFTSAGASDVALLKFDASGLLAWGKNLGNAGTNRSDYITKDWSDNVYVGLNFSGTMDMNPDAPVVNSAATNTTVNSVLVEFNTYGEYKTYYQIEAQLIKGFVSSYFSDNEIFLVGEFTGTNVDVLPLDSVAQITHTSGRGLFLTRFDRCNMHNPQINLNGNFPCNSCEISLSASALGGTPPYGYSWSTKASEQTIYFQCPGYFNVSINDYHNCYTPSAEFTVTSHDGYPFDGVVTALPSSCGNNLGSASVVVTDNMGPYTLDWSNGDTTAVADSLTAGFYTVNITDTTHCYITESFSVENTDGPVISLTATNNPNCSGATTGSVDITVTGGVAPLSFLWSNGATTEDLSGVGPGTYAVIVTDASGCQNQLCVDLTAPEQMFVIQSSGVNSDCFTSNGSIAVLTTGGTEPYSFLWDAAAGAQTVDSAINLPAGMYTVVVTDDNGCTATQTFGVSDNSGPSIFTDFVWYPSCQYGPGYIETSVFGSGSFSYIWNDGITTADDIYNIYGGNYLMTATDLATGCKTTYSFFLDQYPPDPPYVCMVTVDSTGTKNVVVWDKNATPGADYYKIYREGFCNSTDFLVVGTVPQDSLSVFYDTVVNSDTRSWRYYMTCVDSCGYESYPSYINRTIHLSSYYDGAADEVVLNWEAYVGQVISQYNIFRVDPLDSTQYILVDSVDAFTLTYNDDDDLSVYTFDIQYYIEAVPDEPCFASRAFNQNASRSNHTRLAFSVFDTTSTADLLPIEDQILIYPNPANNKITLRVSNLDVTYSATLLSQVGQVVGTYNLRNQSTISTSNLPQGIYYLQLSNEHKQPRTFKLVISH